MGITRDDRWVTDAQGRALAGASVYWCTQPATVPSTAPPSPLATVYSDQGGTTPITQPVLTDGTGHAIAYLDNTILYTVVIYHPLFGTTPVSLTNQSYGSGGGNALIAFSAALLGTIDGTNKVFQLTTNGTTPVPGAISTATVWDNFPLVMGVGYTLSGNTVTFTNPPQIGDALYGQGYYS